MSSADVTPKYQFLQATHPIKFNNDAIMTEKNYTESVQNNSEKPEEFVFEDDADAF